MEILFSNPNMEYYISTDNFLFSKYVYLLIKKAPNFHVCLLYVKQDDLRS